MRAAFSGASQKGRIEMAVAAVRRRLCARKRCGVSVARLLRRGTGIKLELERRVRGFVRGPGVMVRVIR